MQPEGSGGASSRRAAPPEFSIDARGQWFYRDSPIRREAMVRLFAGMLRRDGTGFVLDTPEQRLRVRVADAPFLVVDFEPEDGRLVFVTNLGERYPLCEAHPLLLQSSPDGAAMRVYQLLRDGITARVERATYYRLAELSVREPGGTRHGLLSAGRFFALE